MEERDQARWLTKQLMLAEANNHRRTIQILTFFRQAETLTSCKNNNIPLTIIPPPVLNADLKKLAQNLKKIGMKLTIPIKQISRYYKLPIAECIMSSESISTHVKIPITQVSKNWKLLELQSTPFGWHNETCTLMHDHMYLAVDNNNTRPITGAGLHQCKPYQDRLCYIPRFATDSTYGPLCAFKMYLGATVDELKQHCSFRCHSSKALVISEVSENTYHITHATENAFVRCPNRKTQIDKKFIGQPGSLELKLPCNCSLYIEGKRIIPARLPCASDAIENFETTHVLPASWTTLKSFHFNVNEKRNPEYKNLSECLNKNWTFNVPHINLSVITEKNIKENLEEVNNLIESARTQRYIICYMEWTTYHNCY